MTAATLRNKFAEESPEVRRAAALACARKEDARARSPTWWRCSAIARRRSRGRRRQALRTLTGQDFTTADECAAWWEKQQAE